MSATSRLVLKPIEAEKLAAFEVGGKAAGLLRLVALGARVPPFVVIPAYAFVSHLARPETQGPGPLRERLESVPVSPELHEALGRALATLGPGPFAVRSSMVGEDGSALSYAGQLESFLFRRGVDEVAEAVRRCWASAFAPRVLAYHARAEGAEAPSIGVIVQVMVSGRASGVVFTAHPVTGRRDHALVTGAWGLGEGVVSGLCNADDYVWEHAGREVSAQLAHKDVQVIADAKGPGTTAVAVEPLRQDVRCLRPSEVERVARESLRIAAALGAPQDVEWTLEGDALFILQTRPITALPAPQVADPKTLEEPLTVFDNSNIQESYCGVTTPLTFSFAAGAYAAVYEQTARALGLTQREREALRPIHRNLLALVRGRVYYNINNWYRGLRFLPSFGRNKADMERMMGVDRPVEFVATERLSALDKLRRLPRLLATALSLQLQFLGLRRTVPRWLEDFESVYRSVDRTALAQASLSQILASLEMLRGRLLEQWHTPIINDFRVMMATGALRRLVEQSGCLEVDATMNALLCGDKGARSTEPAMWLMEMAEQARQRPPLRTALLTGSPLAALARARQDPEFEAAFARYVDRYGDRCRGELKLESVSLRMDPSFAVDMLRNYLDRPDVDASGLRSRENTMHQAAVTGVKAGLGAFRRWRLGRVLKAARRAVRDREDLRLCRTRIFGLHRDGYRAIGARLCEAERLDHVDDVFYLTTGEIAADIENRGVATDLRALTSLRKEEYARYEKLEMPNRFEVRGPLSRLERFEDPGEARLDPGRRVLRGTPCYPGVVEAAVRLLIRPDDDLSINGQILVTLRTDPGWAPLFPTASGILVERGSTLSHTAVVARELGIPTVVGIPNLVKILINGERVRMDGARGVVERLPA